MWEARNLWADAKNGHCVVLSFFGRSYFLVVVLNPRSYLVTNGNMAGCGPPLGVRNPLNTPRAIEKRPQYLLQS